MVEEIKKFDISNRLYILILVLVIGAVGYLALDMGFYAFSVLPNSYTKTIVVSGDGKAYAKPDVAIATLGVKTEAKKSDDAVSQNNEKMNVIIKAIKALGIDAKDIQTTAYNLYPVYNYTERFGNTLTGYSLDQQITVKVRNFEKISSVLDAATTSGANDVSNLQITVDNPEVAKSEARKKAIELAKQKAIEMAKNSGLKLGKVVDVQESNYYYPSPMSYNSVADVRQASSSKADIQAGQEEFSITVSLTYQVK
ncbi:MAG: SIMPL domain-containing protein [Candidatus Staskawiczbacteria bacterium]|nr:SIMPL domain-containing protein [Candidatus Staskawiczbacteria bacterium]